MINNDYSPHPKVKEIADIILEQNINGLTDIAEHSKMSIAEITSILSKYDHEQKVIKIHEDVPSFSTCGINKKEIYLRLSNEYRSLVRRSEAIKELEDEKNKSI